MQQWEGTGFLRAAVEWLQWNARGKSTVPEAMFPFGGLERICAFLLIVHDPSPTITKAEISESRKVSLWRVSNLLGSKTAAICSFYVSPLV